MARRIRPAVASAWPDRLAVFGPAEWVALADARSDAAGKYRGWVAWRNARREFLHQSGMDEVSAIEAETSDYYTTSEANR